MEKGVPTRREIEEKLSKVGDYVKMDYLQRCLKQQIDFDTRKFVQTTLAKIYEGRNMFLESGKLIRAAAEINTTYESKMNDYMKSVELFVKAGNYEEADISFSKALACANEIQKSRIRMKQKEFYKIMANELMKKDKRRHALDTYEKLYSLDLSSDEKNEVRQNLLELYQKLGKIKEFYSLQKGN